MNAPHRRNACPGLSTPMPTGDGLLVRFPPAGAMSLDAFTALCEAARRHGNGTIEVTARGSVQVRGLTPRSAPLFANDITALDVAADGVPVITNPLAETNVEFDVVAFAANLRRAIALAELALAPKVSLIVDSGGPLHMDAISTDVRLCVIETSASPQIHIALGGDAATATSLGVATPDAAADIVVRLLRVLAAHSSGRAARIVREQGISVFQNAIDTHLDAAPALPQRPPAEPIGHHKLPDGSLALGIALAFGHAQADTLATLIEAAAAHGARAVRPAPGRALLLIGLTELNVKALAGAAKRLSFIVRADDPRCRIVACPGAPACAWGLIPARKLAADIARQLAPAREGIAVHISGCTKGCAHPAPCAFTLVGTVQGCGLVRNGSARTAPHQYVNPDNLAAEIARFVAAESAHG